MFLFRVVNIFVEVKHVLMFLKYQYQRLTTMLCIELTHVVNVRNYVTPTTALMPSCTSFSSLKM